jgi:hypothetical protein
MLVLLRVAGGFTLVIVEGRANWLGSRDSVPLATSKADTRF